MSRTTNRAKRKARGLPDHRAPLKVVQTDPLTGERKLVTRKSDPAHDVVFRRIGEQMTEEDFITVMESSADPRAHALLKLLVDPRYKTRSLPWFAREAGLSYTDVVMMIRAHGLGDGTIRMSKYAPQAMEDVAIDALSKDVTCRNCKGHMEGEIASVPITEVVVDEETGKQKVLQKLDDEGRPMWERCLTCDGAGTIRQVGDADSRKLMFETLKLTGNKGPAVVQQFNMGGATSMEDSVGDTHSALDIPAITEGTK